jgi:hypothetical protein
MRRVRTEIASAAHADWTRRASSGQRRTCCTGLPVSGIAVSVIAFLLIVMPAVAIVVLMAWLFPTAKKVARRWGLFVDGSRQCSLPTPHGFAVLPVRATDPTG